MNPVIRTLQLSALLILASLGAAAQAQNASTYQIEAILFSQPSAGLTGDRTPDYEWAEDAVMLEETARSDVRGLDVTQHRMDREADKLKAQGYQILMHKAWIQPADSNLKVAVHQGESLGDHYPVEAIVGLGRGQEALQMEVKAWRHTAVRDQNGQGTRIISDQLHQTRRLRLDEVHYLDHQGMGMLVRITRR
ncbi:CsiV family protein [Halopseudomonas sp.]|uniref:CsiV family protein n=1 Tax=Halopseudomonas sp. TaxID=2901191 RepID=UPI003561DABE